ncbi:hypothetical protein TNCV_4919561 [Trichonephila clavipes]|nr:hypothetical protein TNCV_4919561 [Trichonephila clavipes]
MRSPSSALVPPLNRLIYPQILTRCPEIKPGPVVGKRDTLPLHHRDFISYITLIISLMVIILIQRYVTCYRTEGREFCPSDKRATSLVPLAEFIEGNLLLICRGAIYPQKEQPKTCHAHLAQLIKLARLTWCRKLCSSDLLDAAKSSDSSDATSANTATTALATRSTHEFYRSLAIHRLIGGRVCSSILYISM